MGNGDSHGSPQLFLPQVGGRPLLCLRGSRAGIAPVTASRGGGMGRRRCRCLISRFKGGKLKCMMWLSGQAPSRPQVRLQISGSHKSKLNARPHEIERAAGERPVLNKQIPQRQHLCSLSTVKRICPPNQESRKRGQNPTMGLGCTSPARSQRAFH